MHTSIWKWRYHGVSAYWTSSTIYSLLNTQLPPQVKGKCAINYIYWKEGAIYSIASSLTTTEDQTDTVLYSTVPYTRIHPRQNNPQQRKEHSLQSFYADRWFHNLPSRTGIRICSYLPSISFHFSSFFLILQSYIPRQTSQVIQFTDVFYLLGSSRPLHLI